MQTKTPDKLEPSILKFCDSIVPNQQPLYVDVKPLFNKPVNECFVIVPEHMAIYGGEQIFGWYIGEWPKVLIEAIFHAIWHTKDGILIDITPKEIATNRILFLPDPHRKYEGRQVDNIRNPLTGDKRIRRFCQLAHELFLAQNEGDLAYKREVLVTPRIQEIQDEMAQLYLALTRKYG